MSDHIRREDAVNALDRIFDNVPMELTTEILRLRRELRALPSADVVQVVRCDDCKYYGSRRWCELHSSVFDDNAFCSYGERKEREA